MRGAARGAERFTLSHLVLRISLAVVLLFGAWWVCVWFLFFLLFSRFQGNFCL